MLRHIAKACRMTRTTADPGDVGKFYDMTDNPEDADMAICFIESPMSDG